MRRAVAGTGRTLVTLGILILLFVVYQLWGTGIFTRRDQNQLKSQFNRELAQADDPVVGPPTSGATVSSTTSTTVNPFSGVRPAPPVPADGQVEGAITVPKVPSINFYFVEGTTRDDLEKGPGHYPGTPMPGSIGNAAIAGHRTTYLHPFWDLDHVVPGTDIIIKTVAGTFDYRAYAQLVVKPTDVWVADNTPDAELTLTACTPKGSAAHRLVVKAKLVVAKSSPARKAQPSVAGASKNRDSQSASLAQGLSGQQLSLAPSIFWGIVAALIGLAWWWTFRRWRHPLTWIVGVMPFLVVLFPFFVFLERALPSGY